MTLATARDARAPSHALSRAELRVADAVGSLMELWGFRRQLGRIWAVLFLSDRPLAAPDLCERLGISTGLLSMSLGELRRWGVVRGVGVPGDRKEHYQAETDVWHMVRRVLAERERAAGEGALVAFEAALGEFVLPYDAVRAAPDPDATLLDFLSATYIAAADAAGWDRAALECEFGGPGKVRPV